MVKVRRDRPSQRLHHRVSAPILLSLPDGSREAADWSLGGFRLEQISGDYARGDIIDVGVQIPFQGFNISFTTQAQIKRVGEDRSLGFAFLEVGEREQEIMEHFVEEIVRGSMTSVQDTLVRIDTPVTPVSTKPDPNPVEDLPVRRWPLKQVVMTGMYFCAGLFLAGYAYAVFNANFLRMEIESAVVSAPIEPIFATADGKIENVVARPGQELPTNAALVVIENAKVEEKIEMAKIKIERETMELVARRKALAAEEAKMTDYRTMMLTKLEQASARVRALEKQVLLAEGRLRRVRDLGDKGWVTRSKVDLAKKDHAIIKGQLESAMAGRREKRELLKSIAEGRFVQGDKLDSRLVELRANVDLGWDRVMLAKDELLALQRHKDRLTLSAPGDGRLVRLFKSKGSSVKSGERIALFERSEARTIEAFLTQEEILQIGLGDEAIVHFPALDISARAHVVDIDRTGGYIDDRRARYDWRDATAKSGRVVLEFADMTSDDIRGRFLPGMPAVVNFKRRDKDDFFAKPKHPEAPDSIPAAGSKGLGV